MNIEQMRYFKQVCESHSLNKAADKLFISQPALTRSIHAIEKELNITLLTRNKKGVTPTDIGMLVLEEFTQILDFYDQVLVKINNSRSFDKPLIIYSVPSISNACGATLLKKLHHEFCHLQIQFEEILPKDLNKLYEQPNAIALTFDHYYQKVNLDNLPGLRTIHIKDEQVYYFTAKDSPFAQGIIDKKTQYISFRKSLPNETNVQIYCNSPSVSLEYMKNKNAVQALPYSLGKLLYSDSDIISILEKSSHTVSYKLIVPEELFETDLQLVVDKIVLTMQEILS